MPPRANTQSPNNKNPPPPRERIFYWFLSILNFRRTVGVQGYVGHLPSWGALAQVALRHPTLLLFRADLLAVSGACSSHSVVWSYIVLNLYEFILDLDLWFSAFFRPHIVVRLARVKYYIRKKTLYERAYKTFFVIPKGATSCVQWSWRFEIKLITHRIP